MVKPSFAFLAASTLALSSLPSALAVPAPGPVSARTDSAISILDGGAFGVAEKVLSGVSEWLSGHPSTSNGHGNAETTVENEVWFEGMKVERIKKDGQEFDLLSHPAHPEYRLRISTTGEGGPDSAFLGGNGDHKPTHPSICDPNVKQVSGYLDILPSDGGYGKHLFFWFFESRDKPKEDPLVLWLNGGPGCSSTTGLLFELGPCQIADKGSNVTYNPYSWTNKANLIFLDQPVGVGYSYSDAPDGMGVDNSPAAAEDVYAFLTLFVGKFSKYRDSDFHISGESYAGTYLPNIGAVIHSNNKKLLANEIVSTSSVAASSDSSLAPIPKVPVLNFKSILIGNGLTEAATQFASVPEYACDSKYAVYDDPQGSECSSLRSKMKRCENLANACYNSGSKFACVPAGLLCWSGFGQLQDLGLNLYDTRRKCDRAEDKDGPLCYKEMGWIETYMNEKSVKKQLGAPNDVQFKSCNMDINKNFLFQGDVMHNSAKLLPDLIEDGIRLLVYAGVQDLMCNYIGNEEWLDLLPTTFSSEFQNSTAQPFIDSDKKEAGYVRSAGKGAGSVAYMAIYEAGHMVPQDQPQASLDMLNRWLENKPLAKGK